MAKWLFYFAVSAFFAAPLLAATSNVKNHDELFTKINSRAIDAQALQKQGKLNDALQQLQQALSVATKNKRVSLQLSLLTQLGGLYIQLDQLDKAEQTLNSASALVEKSHDLSAQASAQALVQNNLGHLKQKQGHYSAALQDFQRANELALQINKISLAAKTAQAMADVQITLMQYENAHISIEKTQQQIKELPDSIAKAELLIRNARALTLLAEHIPKLSNTLVKNAAERLLKAAKIAESINDVRTASWAWGYLGSLYEDNNQYQQASLATQKAIFHIQQLYAPEVAYRWDWQLGRLLEKQNQSIQAIESYRRAVSTLQLIRSEFATSNKEIAANFRNDAGPVFLQLADLLLQQSDQHEDTEKQQVLLKEARETVELFKTAELQNYFEDDCVTAVRQRIRKLDATIAPGTAVLYPITLDDRLELLLSTSSGLKKYSVNVSKQELVDTTHRFRQLLEKRTTRQYLRQSMQLYRWLIEPLIKDLDGQGIDTLVVVPDAALRSVPLAALHDGKGFLIRRYALATTPSLKLTDPRPIRRENINVLLSGLTQSVQGFPPLFHVSSELEAIKGLYGGTLLEDEAFKKSSVQQALLEKQYSIVHFATHGKFSGKVSDSFILTYDGKMNMDDLEQFVGVSWFRQDQPVELLTLSACETAVGDDTAALGLASVAIKAGARSALASLWSINDQASSELVSSFYRHLQNPDTSKAVALQQAQISFLNDQRYRHPCYWAPFLLIGNWL
jgi:CHAT domain-containing protein